MICDVEQVILDTTKALAHFGQHKAGGKRDGIELLGVLAVELDGLRFEVLLEAGTETAFKFDRVRLAKTRVINTPFVGLTFAKDELFSGPAGLDDGDIRKLSLLLLNGGLEGITILLLEVFGNAVGGIKRHRREGGLKSF